uniref:Uncharacterized protein n=1 Tax=Panagrolaimus sp. PS1159 TaxID=55785 RepID=A0AC35GM45_9BILA
MCKYFFIKNPVIVIDLSYNDRNEELETVLEKIQKCENLSYKFWVTGDKIETTSKIISSIVPHLYKVDAKKIRVYEQTLSFNDFVCFSKNIQNLNLSYSNFKNENDSNIPLEKLVKALPKFKNLSVYSKLKNENYSNIPLEKLVKALPKLKKLSVNQGFGRYIITSEAMKELIKIEHFPQIGIIHFC